MQTDNFLTIAKEKLGQRFLSGGHELDALEDLLTISCTNRIELLKWVMKDKKDGFVTPRVRAGLEFFRHSPEQGWMILEELIRSDNPDDRDTALEIYGELNDSRSYNLVKTLLKDEYPYLQFGACDFLANVFPEHVRETLQGLLTHKNEHIRQAAAERLKARK